MDPHDTSIITVVHNLSSPLGINPLLYCCLGPMPRLFPADLIGAALAGLMATFQGAFRN